MAMTRNRTIDGLLQQAAQRIVLALSLFEMSLLLILAVAYKAPSLDWAPMSTKLRILLVVGVSGGLLSVGYLVVQFVSAGAQRKRAVLIGVTTNVLSVLVLASFLELALRIIARKSPEGMLVGSVLIKPSWHELVEQSRDVLDRKTPWEYWDGSYFVLDPELGWTTGSNRQAGNGLYFSSVEGIRSGAPDVRMSSGHYRHRVAIVGDSNAFSSEVSYEDSWGHHLQLMLPGDVQVLNFGVDGYGIDQMYLRYQRDVRPWEARVVIVGFIGHDLQRSLAVYPFLSFGWPGYVVKPRFSIEGGQLAALNIPLPAPAEIFGAASAHELPFVEYDLGYQSTDWYWRQERWPLLVRLLTSRFPRWHVMRGGGAEDAVSELNVRLLGELVGSIERDGAIAMVVLLSGREDNMDRLARETLDLAGITFMRVNRCLEELPEELRLVPSGNHYSGLANRAIARCTAPAVERALGN